MKTEKIVLVILLTLFTSHLSGCSTKAGYETGQNEAQRNCRNQPPTEVKQCQERINQKTYEEYKNR